MSASSSTEALDPPDVQIPLLPAGGVGPQVAAIGVLEVDGACLYLRAPNGERTLPVFAINPLRWNRSDRSLEAGDKTFRPGQTVTLGGSPVDRLPGDLQWVKAPPAECTASRFFIARSIESGGR